MKNYELYNHTPVYTTKELLDFCAREHGDKEAFAYQNKKQDVSVSFAQFQSEVEVFGSYLFDAGFHNCHIAVFGENSYEWILTHCAVTCGKNVIVPIDKELDAESIAEVLSDSDSRVFIYSNTYADIAECLQTKLPNICYINMKEIPSLIENGKALLAGGYTEYIDTEVNKNDLASIVYTSGTTGKSKGVMLTHNNFCSCMYGACCNVLLTGSSLLVLPLHHTFGLVASVFAVMYYGYPIYINKSLKKLPDDFKKCKPQHLFAVPLIVETLYKNIWATAKKQGKDKLVSKALRKFLCKKESKQIRKQIMNEVFRLENGRIHLPVLTARSMLYDGMRTAGVNNGIQHRAH